MLVEISGSVLIVRRDVSDTRNYRTESAFLFALKKRLIGLGYDAIKKLAYKDGHLVDDTMYYIRDRKKRWCVFDHNHALRNCAEVFDSTGEVRLCIGSGAMVKR